MEKERDITGKKKAGLIKWVWLTPRNRPVSQKCMNKCPEEGGTDTRDKPEVGSAHKPVWEVREKSSV